jgi:hypothetical protein
MKPDAMELELQFHCDARYERSTGSFSFSSATQVIPRLLSYGTHGSITRARYRTPSLPAVEHFDVKPCIANGRRLPTFRSNGRNPHASRCLLPGGQVRCSEPSVHLCPTIRGHVTQDNSFQFTLHFFKVNLNSSTPSTSPRRILIWHCETRLRRLAV